jgi:hypothetical protein
MIEGMEDSGGKGSDELAGVALDGDEVLALQGELVVLQLLLVAGEHGAVVRTHDVVLAVVVGPGQPLALAVEDAVGPARDAFAVVLVLGDA